MTSLPPYDKNCDPHLLQEFIKQPLDLPWVNLGLYQRSPVQSWQLLFKYGTTFFIDNSNWYALAPFLGFLKCCKFVTRVIISIISQLVHPIPIPVICILVIK